MKYLSRFVVTAIIAAPFVAGAQTVEELQAQAQALLLKVQQLQAQLGTSGGTTVTGTTVSYDSSSCPLIGRTLNIGATGDDVTRLQQFLARDPSVYPEALVTGYYGSLTRAAVERWQAKYNIVSSGTPETTGYGQVGPRTAAAISLLCTTGSYGGVAGPSGPAGTSGPVGGYIQVTPVAGNAPLTIAVQATVNTVNSCAGATYTVDYGDGTIPAQVVAPAGQCTQMTQTLGHTYQYGGNYQITLSAGAHRTTASVQVFGAGPTVPITLIPGGTTPSPTPPPSTSWRVTSVTPAAGGNPLAVSIDIQYPACAAYSVDWGDGTIPTGVGAQSGCSGSVSTATLHHTFSGSGTYTISLRDGGGAIRSSSGVSIVN
jgi:peptidoglycan hydrolase-like protein with peptidoglycan-binding domain